MGKIYTIKELVNVISPIAEKHNVSRVYLFGSYARGEADEESDIDLRIDAAQLNTLFALGGLYADLEEALGKSTIVGLRQENSCIRSIYIKR